VDNKTTEETVKAITTAGILGALAGGITFLLSDETPAKKLRTYCAAVMLGLILGYSLMFSGINELYKTALIVVMTASVSQIWPIVEHGTKKLFAKWFAKKVNDVSGPDSN
jgi:hypothetical protein